jgi:hypothetical protein
MMPLKPNMYHVHSKTKVDAIFDKHIGKTFAWSVGDSDYTTYHHQFQPQYITLAKMVTSVIAKYEVSGATNLPTVGSADASAHISVMAVSVFVRAR